MSMTTNRLVLRTLAICLLLGASALAQAATTDADALLRSMQHALVPATEQLELVRVSVKKAGPPDAAKTWDALVVRKRFSDGPHTAIAVIGPKHTAGLTMMTAPRSDGSGIGLWIYSPSERRTLEFKPLKIDQHFLGTDFDMGDLAMNVRPLRKAHILESEIIEGQLCWKVQASPDKDMYYSRIVTWIAQDSKLPLRREYFDRADRLWKVVTYHVVSADAVDTISRITLNDVQSGSRSEWHVQKLINAGMAVSKDDFRQSKLGTLSARTFWPANKRQVSSATDRISNN